MVPDVVVNEVEVKPAGIVTLAGTGSSELLDDSVMVVSPVGTPTVSATLHVSVELEVNVVGLQAIDGKHRRREDRDSDNVAQKIILRNV